MDLFVSDFQFTSQFSLPLLESDFKLVDLFLEVVDLLLVRSEPGIVEQFQLIVVLLKGFNCFLQHLDLVVFVDGLLFHVVQVHFLFLQ